MAGPAPVWPMIMHEGGVNNPIYCYHARKLSANRHLLFHAERLRNLKRKREITHRKQAQRLGHRRISSSLGKATPSQF